MTTPSRRVLLTGATVVMAGAVVLAPGAGAAAPTTTKLSLDNTGSFGIGCTPGFVLTKRPATGQQCGQVQAGAGGVGVLATDVYRSDATVKGVRLDARRHLLGKVSVGASTTVDAVPGALSAYAPVPGPIAATVTVKVNGVKVGSASGSGVVVPLVPGGSYGVTITLNLVLPRAFDRALVKSVQVEVAYTQGVGMLAVSYSAPDESHLVLPTR